jgi:Uma2 family endonuclease
MCPQTETKSTLYDQLIALPEGLRGEIIDEPEVHFFLDTEVLVPDIVGWRQARIPALPRGHKFDAVPDWVCEIFYPSSKSGDREETMPLYGRYGVAHAWLVDPKARSLEAYRLVNGEWVPVGIYRDDCSVWIAPFEAVTIRLADLWV